MYLSGDGGIDIKYSNCGKSYNFALESLETDDYQDEKNETVDCDCREEENIYNRLFSTS